MFEVIQNLIILCWLWLVLVGCVKNSSPLFYDASSVWIRWCQLNHELSVTDCLWFSWPLFLVVALKLRGTSHFLMPLIAGSSFVLSLYLLCYFPPVNGVSLTGSICFVFLTNLICLYASFMFVSVIVVCFSWCPLFCKMGFLCFLCFCSSLDFSFSVYFGKAGGVQLCFLCWPWPFLI